MNTRSLPAPALKALAVACYLLPFVLCWLVFGWLVGWQEAAMALLIGLALMATTAGAIGLFLLAASLWDEAHDKD